MWVLEDAYGLLGIVYLGRRTTAAACGDVTV
jgi:hypothetical protein